MGEWFPASITIGGRLSDDQLDALVAAANDDGAGFDWDQGTLTAADVRARLSDPPGPLTFTNPEASYGDLDALVDFCRAHALSYRSHSDAHYEINAETSYWTPGMEHPAHLPSDNDGAVLIPLDDLRARLAEGKTLAEVVATLDERAGPSDLPPLLLASVPAGETS
jgi:hypothetical protein